MDREAVLWISLNGNGRSIGELDLLRDCRPIRRVCDDLVARTEERQRRVVQRLLAARIDDDLRFAVVDAVVGAVPVANRPLQIAGADDTVPFAVERVLAAPGTKNHFRVAHEVAIDRHFNSVYFKWPRPLPFRFLMAG